MAIITNKIYICLPVEKEIDKLDWDGLSTEEYNGKTYYKIPSGGGSSDVVKKITFETLKDNVTVTLNIVSSSENGCDFAYACYLDGNGGYNNYKNSISGDNKSVTLKYVVPTKGTHWIYIGYRKDSSINKYNDCGYFSIDNSDKEYVIRQPKEVYLASNKMNEITYGSKKILEYGFANTISWDTLVWNKSTDKYTYNTNGPIKFTYYIGSTYKDVVLQNSPKPLPRNDFDGVYFRDVITYMGTSYTKLYKLDLSDWDTSNVTNMANIFGRCSSLSYLNVSGWDTSNVTSMSNMFLLCGKLPSLDVSHFNTSNVKDMDYMFNTCESLVSLDVSHFNTSKVTNMNYMFYGCRKLTYLDVSHFNTNNVLTMSNMFNYCRLLKLLNVSNFDTSKVTNMDGMFQNCESLVSLDLSNFDTSKVTNMERMFQYCESLKTLNVSNFDTSKVTKMNYMFNNCSSLIGLDLTKWTMNTNVSIGVIFYNCKELTTLIDGHESEPNVTIMNGLNKPIDLYSSPKLNYESVYALFRGVATVTSTKTITLPKVMEGKLEPDKVKIATDKGWTIKYR